MSWPGGAGHTSRNGLSARGHAADQVQIHIGGKFDFDNEVAGLTEQVGRLKQLTRTIDDERQQQGELINQLEASLDQARLVLRRTMGRLNIAYKQAQSNHLLMLVLFAFALFFVIYVIAKVYRLGRHIIG
mmetsp:Transcript_5674/g.12549  ORF Transcript_5674/g.12549 Transcript_5674/m.12549 type:complete len:130 (+) Transcript_5674:141-530(+)